MIDPSDYVATSATTARDIDLDEEVVILPDGSRLTEQAADEREQLEAQRTRQLANLVPGRKSLSGDSSPSPKLQVRLPAALHDRTRQVAAAE